MQINKFSLYGFVANPLTTKYIICNLRRGTRFSLGTLNLRHCHVAVISIRHQNGIYPVQSNYHQLSLTNLMCKATDEIYELVGVVFPT